MATTNGTKAAHAARGAAHLLLGSLQNATARLAAALGEEVALVCAGKEGQVALDDLYAAGVIARGLLAQGLAPQGDMAHLALFLAENPSREVLLASEAARALKEVGLLADVEVSAQVDVHEVVPRFQGFRGEGMVFGRG
jgi:2-phosphosulfolactate phosphatase